MTFRNKIFAIVVMSAFVIPNVYVIISGHESFPFTQAPMFGHYIGKETRFYKFDFIAETDLKDKEVYPSFIPSNTSYSVYTSRFFFNKIYKSVENNAPFGRIKEDSPAQLKKRMEDFFSTYFSYLISDTISAKRVRLEISQYNRSNMLEQKHLLGSYDLSTKTYTHLWKEQ